jgi:hypothetical protein
MLNAMAMIKVVIINVAPQYANEHAALIPYRRYGVQYFTVALNRA